MRRVAQSMHISDPSFILMDQKHTVSTPRYVGRCVPTRRMSPEDLHVYAMDVRRVARYNWLLTYCAVRTGTHVKYRFHEIRAICIVYRHARTPTYRRRFDIEFLAFARKKIPLSSSSFRRTPHSTLIHLSLI